MYSAESVAENMEVLNMLEIKNLNKSYGAKEALTDVNLTIPRGEIVGLFGENGAGKTTLMKCILGFHRYSGTITLDGSLITPSNITKISFATGEHSFFPGLTPKAHRDFYAEHFPDFSDTRFKGLMDFFELPMNKALKHFSVGQKNQFEVIMSLCQGADYIIMDEPFAGNDVFNREDFYKVLLGIMEPNETIILSTHLIEEVSDFIGRAVLIHKGRLINDIYVSDLEESGRSLIDFVKETYNYRNDRVSKTLETLTGIKE